MQKFDINNIGKICYGYNELKVVCGYDFFRKNYIMCKANISVKDYCRYFPYDRIYGKFMDKSEIIDDLEKNYKEIKEKYDKLNTYKNCIENFDNLINRYFQTIRYLNYCKRISINGKKEFKSFYIREKQKTEKGLRRIYKRFYRYLGENNYDNFINFIENNDILTICKQYIETKNVLENIKQL